MNIWPDILLAVPPIVLLTLAYVWVKEDPWQFVLFCFYAAIIIYALTP